MTRGLLVIAALAVAACTATPIPLPGSDLGYYAPRDGAVGGLDDAPTSPRLDVKGKGGDLPYNVPPCLDGAACEAGARDGALDGSRDGIGPGELGPGELGVTDANAPPDAKSPDAKPKAD